MNKKKAIDKTIIKLYINNNKSKNFKLQILYNSIVYILELKSSYYLLKLYYLNF